MQTQEEYWKKKINAVVKISKEYEYPEQDIEFWNHQPAGVILLIIDLCVKRYILFETLEEIKKVQDQGIGKG